MLPLVKIKLNARVIGAAQLSPANSGNMQIALPFEVVDGEYAGEHISWIATFHETPDKNGTTGTERIFESLMFMGWQGDDVSDLVGIEDAQAMKLLPEAVELVCEPDTNPNNGKTTLKVKWVNKPGSGRFAFKEPLAKQDAKSFAAQMRNTVKSVRASIGGSRKTSNGSSHPNAPGNKEDAPF